MEENNNLIKAPRKDKGIAAMVATFLIVGFLLLILGIIFFASFHEIVDKAAAESGETQNVGGAMAKAIGIGFAAAIMAVFSLGSLGISGILSAIGGVTSILRYRKQKTSQRYFYLTSIVLFVLMFAGDAALIIFLFV